MIPTVKMIDEEARRSILVNPENGEPATVKLMVAPSPTTPGRIRLAFGVGIVGEQGEGDAVISPPFRIESN